METPSKEENNKNIKLSIQVSLDGLSFCALDKADNKVVFFKEVLLEKKSNPSEVLVQIENLYDKEIFLKETPAEVVVIFTNDLYSLVPERFFDPENVSDYLTYNTKILETDYVAHDKLNSRDIVNAYIPYSNINNFFFDKYGEFEYRHAVSILAENFLEEDRSNIYGPQMYLHARRGGYDLVVIRKGDLVLANSFSCETPEDFLYYLLFTAEQLDLDPGGLELTMLGKITEGSENYELAYRYIRNIRFHDAKFNYIFAPKASVHYLLLKGLQ